MHFGKQSLDDKVFQYGVNQLEKRFRYNPSKLRDGLPDLSRIYKISFPDNFSLSEVAKAFSSDPNVEYAEPIPVYHTTDVPDDALVQSVAASASDFCAPGMGISTKGRTELKKS